MQVRLIMACNGKTKSHTETYGNMKFVWTFIVFKLVYIISSDGVQSFPIQALSHLIATKFHPFNR